MERRARKSVVGATSPDRRTESRRFGTSCRRSRWRRRCNSTDSAQGAGACRSRLAGRPAYDIQAQPRRIDAGADGIEQPPELALGIAGPLPTGQRYTHTYNDRSGHRQQHQRCRGCRAHNGSGHPTDGNNGSTAAGSKAWLGQWSTVRLIQSANKVGRLDAAVSGYLILLSSQPDQEHAFARLEDLVVATPTGVPH